MNYQCRCALMVGMVLIMLSSIAMAAIDPIPGVDIIVKKNPGGISIVATSDANGKFAARVIEPGQYTVSTSCKRLKVCPPYKFSINATGTTLKSSALGVYDFVVVNRIPVVLSGMTYRNLDKAIFDDVNDEGDYSSQYFDMMRDDSTN